MKISIFLFLFIFLFYNCFELCSSSRLLSYKLNPKCPETVCRNSSDILLAYVQSTQANSTTYHYLWSFISGYTPSILFFETTNSAQLDINWSQINKSQNSLNFVNGSVLNSFGLDLSSLQLIDHKSRNLIYPIPIDISWELKVKENSPKAIRSEFSTGSKAHGGVTLKLAAFGESGRDDTIPHMIYTDSNNLFQLTLNNINFPLPEKNISKIEVMANLTVMWQTHNNQSEAYTQKITSINDEYTPGVFQRYIYHMKAQVNPNHLRTSYLDWKPVAYTDASDKAIANSVACLFPVVLDLNQLNSTSFLNAYFSSVPHRTQLLANFTLNSPEDDFEFENKNNYLEFSAAIGLNDTVEETLSTVLKIILVVGFGLPMILFVASIVYTVIRKIRSKRYDNLSNSNIN